MNDSGNTLFVFLIYSSAMLILPVATFFGVKNLLEKEFHIVGFPNTAWSVICAVIVVNLVIMAYAWRAYKQSIQEDGQGFDDVQSKMKKEELDLKKIKKPRYVRVNTLHYTPDEIIKLFRKNGWSFLPCPTDYLTFLATVSKLEDFTFTRDFHVRELLVFSSKAQFHENELYRNGSILLQDKASCLPAVLLRPKPNSVVLDMCSAPGMKTTHLSAIMKNKGKVYAAEVDSRRYGVLCAFIQKTGCSNVAPLHVDALSIEDGTKDFPWAQDVEYILVDPTCSGSGMVDRRNIFKDEGGSHPKRLSKLCRFQYKLLIHALTRFPKVRRVVYSTCSVEAEENEGVAEDVLKKVNSWEEDGKMKFRLATPLEDSWPRRGSDSYEHGRSFIVSNPEEDLTNGFFIAVFERSEECR